MKYEIKIHPHFFFYTTKMTQLHKMLHFQQKFFKKLKSSKSKTAVMQIPQASSQL